MILSFSPSVCVCVRARASVCVSVYIYIPLLLVSNSSVKNCLFVVSYAVPVVPKETG
jgi:hypothetical protein